jgi:hypothetical protein
MGRVGKRVGVLLYHFHCTVRVSSTNWPTVPLVLALALALQAITMVRIQKRVPHPNSIQVVSISKLYVSYSNDLSHYCKSYVMKSPSLNRPILYRMPFGPDPNHSLSATVWCIFLPSGVTVSCWFQCCSSVIDPPSRVACCVA